MDSGQRSALWLLTAVVCSISRSRSSMLPLTNRRWITVSLPIHSDSCTRKRSVNFHKLLNKFLSGKFNLFFISHHLVDETKLLQDF